MTEFHDEENRKVFEKQQSDPEIKAIVLRLKAHDESKELLDYTLVDGVLYQRIFRLGESDASYRLIVARSDRKQLIQDYHLQYGHPGVKRTLWIIAERYYWVGMRKDINHFVQGCRKCQENATNNQKKAGYMVPRRIFNEKQVAWTMDFVGPNPIAATTRNRFILHLQEATTKFNVFVPTRNKKAKTVIRVLDRIFNEYGFP